MGPMARGIGQALCGPARRRGPHETVFGVGRSGSMMITVPGLVSVETELYLP